MKYLMIVAALVLVACGSDSKGPTDTAATKPTDLPAPITFGDSYCMSYIDTGCVRAMECNRLAGKLEGEVISQFDLCQRLGYKACQGITKVGDAYPTCLTLSASWDCKTTTSDPRCHYLFE